MPNFLLITEHVLIGPIQGNLVSRAGAAHGGFESMIARDDVVGENTALTPTADHQALRVRDAALHHMIDAGEQVSHILVAPVSKDAAAEFHAPPNCCR